MHLVELAFGHSHSDGIKLPVHQITLAEKRALMVFSQCFRGSQVHHPMGAYMTLESGLVIEPSTVIRAYTQEIDSHLKDLLELAREIATLLKQECVLLAVLHIPGAMQWIEPEAAIPLTEQSTLASPYALYSEAL